jgi:L-alanine-DL-glutamate epimerase-like enolase superfamily enzyme
VGRACGEAGYTWYEDPYADGGSSHHGHRLLRERLDVPLLETELVRGLEAHTEFALADATDFLRADVEWDGGITGATRIARVAEGLGLDIEYHLAGPAQRHCMAATRNSNYYEFGLIHPESDRPHAAPPVYAGDYEERLATLREDGTVSVPDGPGLGVEYDWGYIRENKRRQRRIE